MIWPLLAPDTMQTSPPLITQSQIDACAAEYTRLTGFHLNHRGVFDHRTRSWYEWLKGGYTLADLGFVITWLKRGIREGKRNPGCLRFSNLIERPDLFGEELAMSKAEFRNKRPVASPKESVIAALPTVRQLAAEKPALPISHYIEQLRRAAQ